MQKRGKIITVHILSFTFLDARWRDKRFEFMAATIPQI
jgi:hypothetical protein